MAAANCEVSEVHAQLGRPQMEAGAAAAVTICFTILQQHGMADDKLRAFDAALRIAFGAEQAQVVAPVAVSPFAVTAEAGAGKEAAAGAATVALFSARGSFPSQGSAFGSASQGPTPE